MPLRVRWTKYAADQLQQAGAYLEESRQGTGEDFIDAVEDALSRVSAFPFANPHIPGEPDNTRKAVLPKYGYWIIYEVRPDLIVVLTVWHAVQQPGSWRDDNAS